VNWVDDGTGKNELFFVVVDDTDSSGNAGVEDGSEDSIDKIALPPRTRSNWVLPHKTGSAPSAALGKPLTDAAINKIDDDGADVYLPFLDKGMYNGRQQMAVRVLNIDLGILRDNSSSGSITNKDLNGESWLPNSGLVYAFREDAIREDGIARPNAETWGNCNTESDLTTGSCTMEPSIPRDPPKQASNGVSPKPIDFVADPDRRPHGFRLSNGSVLGRIGTSRGLSFISDNPMYILGDFNLHSKEEFTEQLQDDYDNFYTRSTLDTGFARGNPNNPIDSSKDTWRPTEILADAITILSNQYCDGTIEAGIRKNNNVGVSGCDGSVESFHNTVINNNSNVWLLQDDSNSPTTNTFSAVPIQVSRNGELLLSTNVPYDDYVSLGNNIRKNQWLNQVESGDGDTTTNLVLVSGTTPFRENESNGGLHNFPRFNENWNNSDADLRFSGSLVQLNFSNYDTAGWDQQEDAFTTDVAAASADFEYYSPPNRLWGYDVALQYNPPGPIVERLLSQSGLRSETYQEIEASDPYIQQLCKAATSNSPTCQ